MNGTLPSALVGLWLIRDIVLMIATHQYVAQNTSPGRTVMDPVTVPIQVIPTTLSKINTGLQFMTLVVGIVAVPLPPVTVLAVTTQTAETAVSLAETIVTSTIETVVTESCSTNLDNDHPSNIYTKNWCDFDHLFLQQRMYITDHILPALCWMTGATTIGSSLSYYGHSAFISTTKSIPDTDSHKSN